MALQVFQRATGGAYLVAPIFDAQDFAFIEHATQNDGTPIAATVFETPKVIEPK